jgi:hypothetical protein
MSDKLQGLLLGYIRENNPDLLYQLDEDDALHAWVLEKIREVELVLQSAKPTYLIETECMEIMTAELKPSKYNYIRDLFEEEFPEMYESMNASGVLKFELINMIMACGRAFDEWPLLDDDHENKQRDHTVIGIIHEYLAIGE